MKKVLKGFLSAAIVAIIMCEVIYIPSGYSMATVGANMEWEFDKPDFIARKEVIIFNKGLQFPYDEQSGLVKGSCRDQFYYVLSAFESQKYTENDTLIQRANTIIENFLNRFIIRNKLAGFRKFGGVIKNLDDDYLSPDGDYDSNYVNFLSPFLVYVYLEYGDYLRADVKTAMKRILPLISSNLFAIRNDITYTNMYLLKCAAELMYARVFKSYHLLLQARYDFLKWVKFVLQNGFPEYNSPNYGFIDWWALGLIVSYSMDKDFYYIAKAVTECFLADFCLHYHPDFDSIVGTSARAKSGSYWWGLQSGSAPFYLYWNASNPERFSSSSTRLLMIKRYFPSAYLKELAIDKDYPIALQGYHMGITTQDYITKEYTLGTFSGAPVLSELGSRASGLSGEQLELSIYHAGSYIPDNPDAVPEKYIRKTCWWDTHPHYQAFNSIQFKGTAISLLNMEVSEQKADDQYYSIVYLGVKKGIGEIRINNSIWNKTSECLPKSSDTIITIEFNDTYLMIRPTKTITAEITDGKLSNDNPILFEYRNFTEDEVKHYSNYLQNELTLTTYLYKGEHVEIPDSKLLAGYIIEITSKNESGLTFSQFSDIVQKGELIEYINDSVREVIYKSALRPGCQLTIKEDLKTHQILSRAINGEPYDGDWLLKSKYASIRRNSDIEDVFKIFKASTSFADEDSDGLPDSWEQTYWGNISQYDNSLIDPNADPDNDGLSNLEEFGYGTDPTEFTEEMPNTYNFYDEGSRTDAFFLIFIIIFLLPFAIGVLAVIPFILCGIFEKQNEPQEMENRKNKNGYRITPSEHTKSVNVREKNASIEQSEKYGHLEIWNYKLGPIIIGTSLLMDTLTPTPQFTIIYYTTIALLMSIGTLLLIRSLQSEHVFAERTFKAPIYLSFYLIGLGCLMGYIYHFILFINMILNSIILIILIGVGLKRKNKTRDIPPGTITSTKGALDSETNSDKFLKSSVFRQYFGKVIGYLTILFQAAIAVFYFLMIEKNEFGLSLICSLHIISGILWFITPIGPNYIKKYKKT